MLLIALFAAAQGLTYPLFSFILERQGHPSVLIGLNTIMTPLGLVVSAPLIPAAARTIGPARLALLSTFFLAALIVAAGAVQNIWAWFPVRFLLGFAINGLYVTSETWINQLASNETRGRIIGLFSAFLSAGFAAGPFTIALVGSEGWPPFLVGIAIVLFSSLVLIITMGRLPKLEFGEYVPIGRFFGVAPVLLLVVGVAAAFDQVLLALLPIYGLAQGLSEPSLATALGIMVIGNILLQFPIGWAGDIWPRRHVMMSLCGLTIIGSAILPYASASVVGLWALIFFWGAAGYGLYTVGLAELGDRFTGASLLAGNAAFAVMWGLGGMAGPLGAGGAMDVVGQNGFAIALGGLYLGTLVILMSRRAQNESSGSSG